MLKLYAMSKLLKKTREDLGKDIKAIAAYTRIKESSLRAIEDEDYGQLPIEVYTRGYIKEYARYLGLPIDSGLEPYDKYLEAKEASKLKKTQPVPEVPVVDLKKEKNHAPDEKSAACKKIRIKTETRQAEGDRAPLGNRFIWKSVLLLIVAAAVIYQFVSSKNAEKEIYTPPAASQEQLQKEAAQPQPEAPLTTDTPIMPASGEVKLPVNQPPVHKRHILEIAANDAAWVRVVTDNETKREVLMKQGDNAIYEANETVSVIVGNAGGVAMKFDGKELPAGRKGEVLRLSLPEKKSPATQSEAPVNPSKNESSNQEAPAKAPKFNAVSPSSEKPAGASQP
jgi:cytoskeleton protein RodZ